MIAPGFLDCYAHPASRWSAINREMYPEPTDRRVVYLPRNLTADALRERLEYELDNPLEDR